MKVVDVLRAARAKIEKPEHWTRGTFARDAYGDRVSALDDKAFSFCAIGAITAVYPDDMDLFVEEYLEREIDTSVAYFNDNLTTTHADILALFDRAIATAERFDRAIATAEREGL